MYMLPVCASIIIGYYMLFDKCRFDKLAGHLGITFFDTEFNTNLLQFIRQHLVLLNRLLR